MPGNLRLAIRVGLALLLLWVFVGGSIGLMLDGDFLGAGIGLLMLVMIVYVWIKPYAGLPPTQRRIARVVTTLSVLAGWAVAGTAAFGWTGEDYLVVGVIGVFALRQALSLPPEALEVSPEAAKHSFQPGRR